MESNTAGKRWSGRSPPMMALVSNIPGIINNPAKESTGSPDSSGFQTVRAIMITVPNCMVSAEAAKPILSIVGGLTRKKGAADASMMALTRTITISMG